MAAETQHAPTWSRIENPADGTPVLPRFGGPCTASLVDILVENPDEPPDWFPEGIVGADQIVLWVLDGLGWNQMVDRLSGLRGIPSMNGAAITTVAPSTTSTALTSISTGRPPGEHGVIGYRLDIEGDILNILRWMTSKGDAARPFLRNRSNTSRCSVISVRPWLSEPSSETAASAVRTSPAVVTSPTG
ncbi:MAG: alkaline phosphatase family protein [Microthrixaceae bacterium]